MVRTSTTSVYFRCHCVKGKWLTGAPMIPMELVSVAILRVRQETLTGAIFKRRNMRPYLCTDVRASSTNGSVQHTSCIIDKYILTLKCRKIYKRKGHYMKHLGCRWKTLYSSIFRTNFCHSPIPFWGKIILRKILKRPLTPRLFPWYYKGMMCNAISGTVCPGQSCGIR
jgi:hypothetical protein